MAYQNGLFANIVYIYIENNFQENSYFRKIRIKWNVLHKRFFLMNCPVRFSCRTKETPQKNGNVRSDDEIISSANVPWLRLIVIQLSTRDSIFEFVPFVKAGRRVASEPFIGSSTPGDARQLASFYSCIAWSIRGKKPSVA